MFGNESAEDLSLGSSLHDGILEKLSSDLMARTLTFVIDSPFHWHHHHLPGETRFEIVAEGVRVVEVFNFESWPGASEPPKGIPYAEAEQYRHLDYLKGRLQSADWKIFAAEVQSAEHTILNCTLNMTSKPLKNIKFGILNDLNSEYREVQIQAEGFRFLIAKRELSAQDFEAFGHAYWDAWSAKNAKRTTVPEFSEQAKEVE